MTNRTENKTLKLKVFIFVQFIHKSKKLFDMQTG